MGLCPGQGLPLMWMAWPKSTLFSLLSSLFFSETGVNFTPFFQDIQASHSDGQPCDDQREVKDSFPPREGLLEQNDLKPLSFDPVPWERRWRGPDPQDKASVLSQASFHELICSFIPQTCLELSARPSPYSLHIRSAAELH